MEVREGENVKGRSLNQKLDSSTSSVYLLSEGERRFEGDVEVYCSKDGGYDKMSNGGGWYQRRNGYLVLRQVKR